MNISPKDAKLSTFDVAEYLDNDDVIAAYLTTALESGDAQEIASSLGDIARAYGMTQLARKTGLTRSSLYKSLDANGHPKFETILAVMKGLGLSLQAKKQTSMPR